MKTLRGFRGWLTSGVSLLPRTACAAILLLSSARCQAQPPAAVEAKTVEGKVQQMTTAPKGEIDGAVLDDGTLIHWPPHLQDRFTRVVVLGEPIRATGRTETGRAGDVRFEVDNVSNTRTNVSTTNPDYASVRPRPADGPRGRGKKGPRTRGERPEQMATADRGETVDVKGTVTRVTTAPRGEIDGAVLDNGTLLHWPPHMQDQFTTVVKAGEQVRATGRTETGGKGDTHFEVQSVTNTRTNQTIENTDLIASSPSTGLRRDDAAEHTRQLNDLGRQIEQLRREVERLRRDK